MLLNTREFKNILPTTMLASLVIYNRLITERETGGPPDGGPVHKDRGPGDGGAARQTPGGPDTKCSEPRFVPRPPPRANTRGHY